MKAFCVAAKTDQRTKKVAGDRSQGIATHEEFVTGLRECMSIYADEITQPRTTLRAE